jgi:hypothetical protein
MPPLRLEKPSKKHSSDPKPLRQLDRRLLNLTAGLLMLHTDPKG